MSSSNPQTRNPLVTIALSILCFVFLDAAIFRSGLYARVSSPMTTAGKFLFLIAYEQDRPADASRDVLMVGNSKMEWAFWVKQFKAFLPHSRLRPVMGASSGSTEEWWYYMLHDLDPKHDRYAAIVIQISGYKISPWTQDFANRFDNAQVLAPILRWYEWPGFLRTFTDPDVRRRATLLAVSSAHDYALDLQDLLLNFNGRMHDLDWRRKIGERWMYNEEALSSNVEALKLDPLTGRIIAYPPQFNAFKRRETDSEFVRPTLDVAQKMTERNAAFERYWLGRIIEDYSNSKTKLIFLQTPRWPMPLPAQEPVASAPDVRDMIPKLANVIVLDPKTFANLEQPRYFMDMLHLNHEGRIMFTDQLGEYLERTIGRP